MIPPEIIEAQLAYAELACAMADRARLIVGSVGDNLPPGARISRANDLHMASIVLVTRAALVELATGATWRQVADAMHVPVSAAYKGLRPDGSRMAAAAKRGPTMTLITDRTLLYGDGVVDTATTLDTWCIRHTEPWEEPVENAVSRIFQLE